MDLGSLFLLVGLLILTILYISRPFFIRKATVVSQEEHDLSVLLAEQERVITALQELDFDYALGKVPEADYPAQRSALLVHGVEVMRQVDALQSRGASGDLESRIESAIAARRADASRRPGKRAIPVGAAPDDEIEAMLAARRRQRSEKAAGFCPQCGHPFQQSDQFCARCGTTLALDVPAGQ